MFYPIINGNQIAGKVAGHSLKMETKCQTGTPSSKQIFLLQVGLLYIGTLQVHEVPTFNSSHVLGTLTHHHMRRTAGC